MASELLGEPKIEREYAPERVEHFEASLDVDTDDHDSVVLTDKEEPQEPANASSRRYRPAAADEAQAYIEEIRARMDYGEGFGLGL